MMNLTKRTIVIALLINAALMGVSYRLGFCLNYAIPCTALWVVMMGVAYFLPSNRVARMGES